MNLQLHNRQGEHMNPKDCKAKFLCTHPKILGKKHCPHCVWNKKFIEKLVSPVE
jgi:hypothetical protein